MYRNPAGFSDYGTVLFINSVQYTPDGRSLVKTIGERRFMVVGRDMVDGYHQAQVRFVFDERVTEPSEIGEFFFKGSTVHSVYLCLEKTYKHKN